MREVTKREFAAKVRHTTYDLFPEMRDRQGGMCVYANGVAMHLLREAGVPVVPQGGSLHWPIIKPEQDDGVRDTHFSYQWDYEQNQTPAIAMLVAGKVPEVHCWLGIVDTQEVLDFSLYGLKRHASLNLGDQAAGMEVPDYLWQHELPWGVHYKAEYNASSLAEWLYGDCMEKKGITI